jgi:hypothetical protein
VDEDGGDGVEVENLMTGHGDGFPKSDGAGAATGK